MGLRARGEWALHPWALDPALNRWRLHLGLALFDIIGEVVAQGTTQIVITLSFVGAIVLLILAWRGMRPSPSGPRG